MYKYSDEQKEQRREYCRKYYRERYTGNKYFDSSVKNSILKRKYGISTATYTEILKSQNHCCAICGKNEGEFKKSLEVDHNHDTGAIRGLLCMNCNLLIGKAHDSQAYLYKVIAYLDIDGYNIKHLLSTEQPLVSIYKTKYSNNKSGFRGVHWERRSNKWKAEITRNGKKIHLGLFKNIEDAANAYRKAVDKYNGTS